MKTQRHVRECGKCYKPMKDKVEMTSVVFQAINEAFQKKTMRLELVLKERIKTNDKVTF